MALQDLSDAELGRIVREGPLWPILLEMENKQKAAGAGKAPAANNTEDIRTNNGEPHALSTSKQK